MGFAIEVVKECPVTRGSSGVLTMTADQVAMVAGAVRDKIEWMVLLHGQRSEDGYEVRVDRFTVPVQYRSSGEVELAQDIVLPADCVGVMHSHHRMGAFFSSTDTNELNPRFPSSIVVAVSTNNLGFDYRACGKVQLPCGAMGLVDFWLAVEGVERFAVEPVRGEHDAEKLVDLKAKDGGLQGCTHRQYVQHPEDNYLAVDAAACGLSSGEVIQRPLVFGMNGADLLAAVVEQTRKPPSRQLPAHYQGNGSYTTGGGKGTVLSDYWERKKRERDEAVSALDQAKGGKGKRRGKGSKAGKRNGLVKLERPEPEKKPYTVEGRCDGCGHRDKIQFVRESNDWLCDFCLEDMADQLLASEDLSFDDRTVIVTDEIDMDQVNGYGFGV